MKSGKTIPLIIRYQRERAVKHAALSFRPSADTRDKKPIIISRFGDVSMPARLIDSSRELAEAVLRAVKAGQQISCVLIDEGQFFDQELPETVDKILNLCDVEVAGLDLDYRGLPFGPMGSLLAMAHQVHKYTALCDICGQNKGRFTQRLNNGQPASAFEEAVIPEGVERQVSYEVRCPIHYQRPTDLARYLQKLGSRSTLS